MDDFIEFIKLLSIPAAYASMCVSILAYHLAKDEKWSVKLIRVGPDGCLPHYLILNREPFSFQVHSVHLEKLTLKGWQAEFDVSQINTTYFNKDHTVHPQGTQRGMIHGSVFSTNAKKTESRGVRIVCKRLVAMTSRGNKSKFYFYFSCPPCR